MCFHTKYVLPYKLKHFNSLLKSSLSTIQVKQKIKNINNQIRSDQINHSVVSDSLRPHEWQHARPPYPSPTPRVHWDSRPSSQWCHPAISYTKAFLSWSDLVCPLPMQATYSSLAVLPPRWGGDAPRVDLIASLTDVQLLTIKTLLTSDATRGAIRVTFQNASQAKLLGETFLTWVLMHYPEYILDNNKTNTNIKLRCSFQASPHQYKSLLSITIPV